MITRVGNCQEVNKPAMTVILMQLWSSVIPRKIHRSLTMTPFNVMLSSNGEARQVSDLPSRSFDQDAQNKQDPMTVEHHLCLSVCRQAKH